MLERGVLSGSLTWIRLSSLIDPAKFLTCLLRGLHPMLDLPRVLRHLADGFTGLATHQ
jgi:hypothetical protein